MSKQSGTNKSDGHCSEICPDGRYLTSPFLGHARASDLEREIKCALEGIIDRHQLTMVPMNGLNVNLSLLGILKSERKEGGQPDLIDIGICNQHVLHIIIIFYLFSV